MRAILEILIRCGTTTCAEKPGKFCPWFRTQRFGTTPYCALFSEASTDFGSFRYRFASLQEKNGWLQRHPQCLKLEAASYKRAKKPKAHKERT